MTARQQLVPHNRVIVTEGDVQAVSAATASGQWASGPAVRRLEENLQQRTGRRHAICVGSGLGALRLILAALGIGERARVAVPGYSCVALANAALALGAAVVETDVEVDSWNIDSRHVEASVSAVVGVNTFGTPFQADVVPAAIPVIEDCAHSLGVDISGVPFGSRTDHAITSFYATKLVGGGEGGAVLTDDDDVADEVRRMRDYSDQPPDPLRLNDKISDIAAALINHRLECLPDFLEERRSISESYAARLASLEAAGLIRLPSKSNATWYRFVVEVPSMRAEDVVLDLKERGVEAARPVEDWRTAPMNTPIASRAHDHLVSLPIYPGLTDAERERVVTAVEVAAGGWR